MIVAGPRAPARVVGAGADAASCPALLCSTAATGPWREMDHGLQKTAAATRPTHGPRYEGATLLKPPIRPSRRYRAQTGAQVSTADVVRVGGRWKQHWR